MPSMPSGSEEGILRGMYRLRSSSLKSNSKNTTTLHVHLLGSGSILRETLKAQEILADRYQGASDVWSVTSYKELRREALDVERLKLLAPGQERPGRYVEKLLAKEEGAVI